MRSIHVLLIVAVSLIFASCEPSHSQPSADQVQKRQTEQAMAEAVREVGMPGIHNFQEKKIMKMIYELRDKEDYICYAYIVDMHGALHFMGKCIGYGLPYSTQFSNPEKLVNGYRELGYRLSEGGGIVTMPQPEPNGLFMPEGLAATWLLMLDPETNEPRPVYLEPEIVVSPFPLH